MKGVKNGRFTSQELVLKHLESLVASNLTIPKYAKLNDLNPQTLRNWARKNNVTRYNKGNPNFQTLDPELKERMIIRIYELRNTGLSFSQISKEIEKEIHPLNPGTVSNWLRGVNCDFPWRKRLITGWKRSKQLSNYIEGLKCLA